MPPFLSFSVLGYTPVSADWVGELSDGASTSGWTMLMRCPYAWGFPKNTNSLPGTRRLKFHLMPLKNTISILPLPSSTVTEKRFTALKRISPSWGIRLEPWPQSVLETTRARICT